MRCGMCQAVCPVFAETGREADVARGKLALLDGLIQEMFKDPKGVNERMMRCLLCGSCAANCPSGVKVLDIFLKARAILVGYMGLHPAKRIVFRGMLAHPTTFQQPCKIGEQAPGVFRKTCRRLSRHILRTFLLSAGGSASQDFCARFLPLECGPARHKRRVRTQGWLLRGLHDRQNIPQHRPCGFKRPEA